MLQPGSQQGAAARHARCTMGRSFGYTPSHVVFRWIKWTARGTESSCSSSVTWEAPQQKSRAAGGVPSRGSHHTQQCWPMGSSPALSRLWCSWQPVTCWLLPLWFPSQWWCGSNPPRLPHPHVSSSGLAVSV